MKTLDLSQVFTWLCAIVLAVLTLAPLKANDEEVSFYIVCPADQWVTCEDEIWDLSIYGNAYYHDYSGDHDAGEPVNSWNLNSCNVGYIYRTWTVEDYNWNQHSCTQVIHVQSTGNFTGSDITWPMQDLDLEGCYPDTHPSSLPEGYGYPEYPYEACSMVAHSYSDQIFNISGQCKKLIRKWTVIDWCQYNPNSGSNYGIWTYWQVIKLSQSDVPDVVCLDDVTVSSYNCNDAYVELPDLVVPDNSCGGSYMINNNSPYADDFGANASGVYPIGTTHVKYTVVYGCGQKKTCTFKVTVSDDKGPTVYCLAHVAVPLMGMDTNDDGINDEGMVEIWASDLDFGSTGACGHEIVSYSFSEDPEDTHYTFTCDHLGENAVNMWVTDEAGNQAYCTVIVEIQNNGAQIEPCVRTVPEIGDDEDEDEEDETETLSEFRVSGTVLDQFNSPVMEAAVYATHLTVDTVISVTIDTIIEITLDSFINNSGFLVVHQIHDSIFVETIDTSIVSETHEVFNMSEEDGLYSLDELPADTELILFGEKASYEDNRITKDDILFLLDYLMGNEEINSPYILMAADTDDNGKVDFTDVMNLIAKVMDDTPLPTENPWIVFDSGHEFENEEDPFSTEIFTEYTIQGEEDSEMTKNFMAIYKGDVVHEDLLNLANIQEIEDEVLTHDEVPIEVRDFIEEFETTQLLAYPNPFDQIVAFEFNSNKNQNASLRLINALGETIYTEQKLVTKGINNWSVEGLESNTGIILYEIQLGKKKLSGKLIKE